MEQFDLKSMRAIAEAEIMESSLSNPLSPAVIFSEETRIPICRTCRIHTPSKVPCWSVLVKEHLGDDPVAGSLFVCIS